MELTLTGFSNLLVFQYLLVFCRMGSAIMLMPGIGEIFVLRRARLFVALAVSLVLLPVLAPNIPAMPATPLSLAMLMLSEILIGVFIGGLARMIQAVLHVAGAIMAFLSSLAAAQLFDATQGSQGSVFGNLLTIFGLVLFFVFDLHHLFLRGMVETYSTFAVGDFPPVNDFADLATLTLNSVFVVGFKIAAPQLIVGMSLYLAAGIMARLVPSIQVFFLLMPIQILASFYTLLFVFSTIMMWYIFHMEDTLHAIFYP